MLPRRFRTRLSAGIALACLLPFNAHGATPSLRYEVVARYAHLDTAFTQGLELDGDTLYESSGLYERSYLAVWSPQMRSISKKRMLPESVFGEGLTLWRDRIYVLTWRGQRGFIFDRETLKELGQFTYSGEGWGLTHDGQALIMSDGTSTLRFLDPLTLHTKGTLEVTEDGNPVKDINELEWLPAHDREPVRLLANIWQRDQVVVIDPGNGHVTARIDFSRLYPKPTRDPHADVLNGIALDSRDRSLLITGKFWPYLYRVHLLEKLP